MTCTTAMDWLSLYNKLLYGFESFPDRKLQSFKVYEYLKGTTRHTYFKSNHQVNELPDVQAGRSGYNIPSKKQHKKLSLHKKYEVY